MGCGGQDFCEMGPTVSICGDIKGQGQEAGVEELGKETTGALGGDVKYPIRVEGSRVQ